MATVSQVRGSANVFFRITTNSPKTYASLGTECCCVSCLSELHIPLISRGPSSAETPESMNFYCHLCVDIFGMESETSVSVQEVQERDDLSGLIDVCCQGTRQVLWEVVIYIRTWNVLESHVYCHIKKQDP